MKVKQLIEKLAGLDRDMDVVIAVEHNGYSHRSYLEGKIGLVEERELQWSGYHIQYEVIDSGAADIDHREDGFKPARRAVVIGRELE